MPNVAALLKTEIARVARKEVRAEIEPLRKSNAQYRSAIGGLKRKLEALEKQLARAKRQSPVAATPAQEEADAPRLRFRQAGFSSLRQKWGLSAADMGKLVGVTGQSIYAWEQGKSRPRASQLQAIADVRKLGKREVLQRLEQAQ
jgi:DNA-binding XRE family transcriptional regulator